MAKKVNDLLREEWVNKVTEWLTANDEEVLRTGSNVLAIPVIDSAGEENYIQIVVKVPTGSRDGDAYEPYSEAEDYAAHVAEMEEKRKAAAAEKERKIAADKKAREARAAARAKHEAEKNQ